MPRSSWLLTLLALSVTNTSGHEFRIENGQGFTVSPTTLIATNKASSVYTQEFYIYSQSTATKVVASLGHLKSEVNIIYPLNNYDGDYLNTTQVVNLNGANITAHLVRTTVLDTRPILEVLFHSDSPLESPQCMRAVASISEREKVSHTCLLHADSAGGSGSAVCVARVLLPFDWWSSGKLDAHFDVLVPSFCAQISNSIKEVVTGSERYRIGDVILLFEDRSSTREYTEDEHISISIPSTVQQQGSQFDATLKLQGGSDLKVLVARVTTGDGVRLQGTRSADPSTWTVLFDEMDDGGVISVFVQNASRYISISKVQELAVCHFEVGYTVNADRINITWEVQYESSLTGSLYYEDGPSDKKITKVISTSVGVAAASSAQSLVAVLKSRDVVSLKRFTSTVASLPVWLYAVDLGGKVMFVGHSASCFSTRQSVLQVSKLCDTLYLSAETADPGIVEVKFIYGGVSVTVDVTVWYPEAEVFIKLSDEQMHEIKGWKRPPESNNVDVLDSDVQCIPMYQTTKISVFAQFYTVYKRRAVYLRRGKLPVFSDITHLLENAITTSDPAIVKFENGILRAEGRGRSDIKVISATGQADRQILASKEVKVTTSKVTVDLLKVKFVSDFTMKVTKNTLMPGLLTASYDYEHKLSDKHPEGLLDISVQFTDGINVPLADFRPSDYQLTLDNLSPEVLALSTPSYTPDTRVKAIGTGRGTLKLTLNINNKCQKKRQAQPLATAYVYIEADVKKVNGLLVNDAAYIGKPAAKSQMQADYPVEDKVEPVKLQNLDKQHVSGSKSQGQAGRNLPASLGSVQATPAEQGVSQLEVGMFVVMGVLGVVASVFVTNCLIYVHRQRKARDGPASVTAEEPSTGWVWLGKDTLEEHSIATCPDRLLNDRDFAKRCSRSDSMQSMRSKRSSSGTYKGSECSVRITVNPRYAEEEEGGSDEDVLFSQELKRPVIGPINDDEIFEEELDNTDHTFPSMPAQAVAETLVQQNYQNTFIIHKTQELDSLPIPKPVDLTQEEFDNLRETVA